LAEPSNLEIVSLVTAAIVLIDKFFCSSLSAIALHFPARGSLLLDYLLRSFENKLH
jgi:hypothetical protein